MVTSENKRHIWESKDKDEVHITTAGSRLKTEKIPLYAERLLNIIQSYNKSGFNIIKELKKYEVYDRGLDYSINDLCENLRKAVDNIKDCNQRDKEQLECHQSTADQLIKLLVAKLEKYEIIDLLDNEVMTLLPDEQRDVIVDVASGIGRFIPYFSERFKSVIQIDFSEGNILKAKEVHKDISNVEYRTLNIMNASFKDGEVDLIFGNWILQYLENNEVKTLIPRTYRWLDRGKVAFFRESIKTNFEGYIPSKIENPANFRDSESIYEDWFSHAKFSIVKRGNIKTYEYVFDNPNQIYWILRKA